MGGNRTTSSNANAPEAVARALDRLDGVIQAHPLPGAPDLEPTLAAARRRALAVVAAGGADSPHEPGAPDGANAAVLFYASDVLATLAIELAAHRDDASALIGEVTAASGLSPVALAREVLRSPSLLGFPPAVAIEVQLGLLMAFAPLRDLGLWMPDEDGDLQVVSRLGKSRADADAQQLARRLLEGNSPLAEQGALIGLGIKRWDEPAAALIARPDSSQREHCLPLLEQAPPGFGAILEREHLVSRHAGAERALTQAHERRLARLGFDIHDGPLQDLALLGEDIRLLRSQIGKMPVREAQAIMLGRLEDLEAQLVALDGGLRRISASLQSPFMASQPVPGALEDLARAFSARSGIEPALEIDGELEDLTDSQQMALLSIVREALSNVRDHSHASTVCISVTGGPASIDLRVTDNGVGFDVEKALMRAARDGRLGLVGLHERARLLGGSAHVESSPGQPTSIYATLPRWQAVASAPREA
jgi:signal transduction histidine kinase